MVLTKTLVSSSISGGSPIRPDGVCPRAHESGLHTTRLWLVQDYRPPGDPTLAARHLSETPFQESAFGIRAPQRQGLAVPFRCLGRAA